MYAQSTLHVISWFYYLFYKIINFLNKISSHTEKNTWNQSICLKSSNARSRCLKLCYNTAITTAINVWRPHLRTVPSHVSTSTWTILNTHLIMKCYHNNQIPTSIILYQISPLSKPRLMMIVEEMYIKIWASFKSYTMDRDLSWGISVQRPIFPKNVECSGIGTLRKLYSVQWYD